MDSNVTFKAVAGGKTFVTLVTWKRSLPSVNSLMDDKFGFEEARFLAPFTWKHFSPVCMVLCLLIVCWDIAL